MTVVARPGVALRKQLDEARARSPASLADAVIGVARQLLTEALARETSAERARKSRLGRLLSDPRLGLFGSALADRAFRSSDPERTVATAATLVATLGLGARATGLDGLLLGALSRLGPLFPDLAREGILARVAAESEDYVLSAEVDALSQFLAARTAEGFSINLNYLGEEVLGEREAAKHAAEYRPYLKRSDLFALSVKLSGLTSRANAIDPESTVRHVYPRLVELAEQNLALASPTKLLYFDMEAYRDIEATHAAFERLAADFPTVPLGIAIQAYLPESTDHLSRVIEVAAKRGRIGGGPIFARLVKGANLGMERVLASRSGLEVPVFPDKASVDAQYKRLLGAAIEAEPEVLHVGVATHNLFDVSLALVEGRRHPSRKLHFEMLAGMAGSLGRVLLGLGERVILYAPAVLPETFSSAIAYLLRRLDESTAPENFLRKAPTMEPGNALFLEEAAKFRVSLATATTNPTREATRRTQNRSTDSPNRGTPGRFSNCADTDFTRPSNREALRHSLEAAREDVPVVLSSVAGRAVPGPERSGFDPSRPNHVAYRYSVCSRLDVEHALSEARVAQARLAEVDVEARVELLDRVADEIERSRFRLVAAMVKDTGKRVLEADVEVSEAVDFARYYAHEFRALRERYDTTPLGVVSVTPPWNFPLAIPLGGILAALVTGNAVLFKPAPEALLVGFELHACLGRAGVDPSFVQFLVVDDDDASPLVADERVDAVILTGATETALRFLRMRPNLRLLAETGGKNCAYVSAEADREAAIHAIVQSAFGHAGQKCSALSVLVLEQEVYESRSFRAALVDAASSLLVGSAWDADTFVTPLIHPPRGPLAYALETLERGERYLLTPKRDAENPRLVSPAIRDGVRPRSPSHRNEFFGPHLALLPARNLDEALRLMNATRYGLTAGLFSLNAAEQDLFVARTNAGNLYVNRALTGAVVGRQPFGGRKASSFGPGAKAGGPNYLPQLCQLTERGRAGRAGAKDARRTTDALSSLNPEDFTAECRTVLAKELLAVRLTEVVGEKNELRYERAEAIVVALGDTDEIALRACISAFMAIEGAFPEPRRHLRVFRSGSGTFSFEATYAGIVDFRELGPEIVPELDRRGTRIRVLGRGALPLLDRLRRAGSYVEVRPLRSVARTELLFFLREKSVSVEAHRYGNLRLADIEGEVAEIDGPA